VIAPDNAKPDLIRIIYASTATSPMNLADLLDLLEAARGKNLPLGITGMLVYEDGSFLQLLEGKSDAVRALFARVQADRRHTAVTKLVEEPIEAPTFADWSMGFVRAAREDLLSIPGCNDFFATGARLRDIDLARARVVLKKVREGMWHKKAG